MLNLFKKQPQVGTEIVFKIVGMHCTSCSLNIDDALEEIEGVQSAQTSYARSISKVRFNPAKVDVPTLKKTIENLGYTLG